MSAEKPKVEIPERHQAFCKAVARLAREHDLNNFTGSFRPGYDDEWRGDISFSWEQGRHGEDAGSIRIGSQFSVHAKIGDGQSAETTKDET